MPIENHLNPCQSLIACTSCGKDIAALAVTCPGCGAPNGWRHPGIDAFYAGKDRTGVSKPFTFQSDKTKVWGQTAKRLTKTGYAVLGGYGIIGGPLVLLFTGFWGAFIFFLIGGALSMSMQKQDTFTADLQSKSWISSNDIFWQPVRKLIGI